MGAGQRLQQRCKCTLTAVLGGFTGGNENLVVLQRKLLVSDGTMERTKYCSAVKVS